MTRAGALVEGIRMVPGAVFTSSRSQELASGLAPVFDDGEWFISNHSQILELSGDQIMLCLARESLSPQPGRLMTVLALAASGVGWAYMSSEK